jgi:hypothetical protein
VAARRNTSHRGELVGRQTTDTGVAFCSRLAEHETDKIDVVDFFGDWVLDLESRVDLEKIKIARRVIDKVFDLSSTDSSVSREAMGGSTDHMNRPCQPTYTRRSKGGQQSNLRAFRACLTVSVREQEPGAIQKTRRQTWSRRYERRGRFLDYLLVPALDRTLSLSKVDNCPQAVSKDLNKLVKPDFDLFSTVQCWMPCSTYLDLDVACRFDVFLEEDSCVGKKGLSTARYRGKAGIDFGGRATDLQTYAAAATSCLWQWSRSKQPRVDQIARRTTLSITG